MPNKDGRHGEHYLLNQHVVIVSMLTLAFSYLKTLKLFRSNLNAGCCTGCRRSLVTIYINLHLLVWQML